MSWTLSEEYKLERRLKKIEELGRLGSTYFTDVFGYVYVNDRLTGKHVKLHRYFWEFYNGPIPEGMIVHHKNGNKKCNCIANLELCTKEEHNYEKHNRSEDVARIWAKRSREERERITLPGRQASPSWKKHKEKQ